VKESSNDPTSKAPASGGGSGKRNTTVERWINPTPNSSDVDWLTDHETELPSLFLEILDDIGEEERLSIKYDAYSSRWLAVLFASNTEGRNKGAALSVRGATPYDSLSLLAYFHIVRYNRIWLDEESGISPKWG
jgi:hypothetical protein